MATQQFVRVDFDGSAKNGAQEATPDGRRKLRFRHQDLRDAVAATGKNIGELFTDPFGGWAPLIQFGLRWQDPKVTLNKASDLIDAWALAHADEPAPLDSLGDVLLQALMASGLVKIQAPGADDQVPAETIAETARGND